MILGIIFSFIFGAVIGSFLNVVILRLPAGKTIGGHSHCMHCKHLLGPLDLVPLFSYVFLGGRCRYCKKSFSRRYFYIELITALLFTLSYVILMPTYFGGYLLLVKYFLISATMVAVFMIDYENFLILDDLVIFSTVSLFVINLAIDLANKNNWLNSLTFNGLLAASGLYAFFGGIYYISKGKWLGFGDVKFSFVLGLAVGAPLILVNVFLAFAIGSVVGILLLLARTKELKSEIPFGTFLALACLVTLFYGPQIFDWYLRITGLKVYV